MKKLIAIAGSVALAACSQGEAPADAPEGIGEPSDMAMGAMDDGEMRVLGAAVGVVVGAGDGADDGGHTSQTYRRRFEQSLLSKRAIPESRVMLRDVVPC